MEQHLLHINSLMGYSAAQEIVISLLLLSQFLEE